MGGETVQKSQRTRKKAVVDHVLLDKCRGVMRPTTWKRTNELHGKKAVAEKTTVAGREGAGIRAVEAGVSSAFEPPAELTKLGQ